MTILGLNSVGSRAIPNFPTSFSEIVCSLRTVEIGFRIAGASKLVLNPALPGKLRGALGTALHGVASAEAQAGGVCRWSPPCAYQVLWNKAGELRPGYAVPSPYVIEANTLGDDLWITVRLFGLAGDYAGEVADALIRGLRSGLSGIGVLEPTQRALIARDGLDLPQIRGMAELAFVTPVLIRNTEKGNHVDPHALLVGLVDRIDGLAWWQGLSLDPATRQATLDAIAAVDGSWEQAEVVPWRRGAMRQGKILEMGGAIGRVIYRGDLRPLAPLLALGEVCFAGARTAFGQGRYRLERVL